MTSNLATDQIMDQYADEAPETDDVVAHIRPVLSAHFKPALLARMSIVPFRPIDRVSMHAIAKLKLGKLTRRIEESHDAQVTIADELLEEIVSRCTTAETGARNIDHILRGTLLPKISKGLLEVLANNEVPTEVELTLSPGGEFRVDIDSVEGDS